MISAPLRRAAMVQQQLAARGVDAPAVLHAMGAVPRERFVDAALADAAYADRPLPIGEEQTISQPYMVATMLQAADVRPGDLVLEVGAGSGYVTAVLAYIAGWVCALERRPALAAAARERLHALGLHNVDLRQGDGWQGWPEQQHFNAIVVSAAAPEVPPALKAQLAAGGRLVMPVGDASAQRLLKLTRRGAADYEEQWLEAVRFVPLVGTAAATPAQRIAAAAEPLPPVDDPAFGRLFDRFADCRIVLLGESTHGSAEFYLARAAITRHLVQQHGFELVALEADWPDAAALDRHVRGLAPARARPPPFQRFPRWLWRNAEFAAFVAWLREHNAAQPAARRTRLLGLDLYNLHASIATVLAWLERVDPALARTARRRYGCLMPWQDDPADYGRAAQRGRHAECEQAVVAQCRELLARELDWAGTDPEGFLDAAHSARLVAAAERYYRALYAGGAESWNLRDAHMAQTLQQWLDHLGPHARAVVWAHNAHVGDARCTDMGRLRGELNLGQRVREHHGTQAALIGLGTYEGTLLAAADWDAPMQVMPLRPAQPDSVEHVFHAAGCGRALLDLRQRHDEGLRQWLAAPRPERHVGAVYRPDSERHSHYVGASLLPQFDAWVWFDRTHALTPLGAETAARADAQTFPFGD